MLRRPPGEGARGPGEGGSAAGCERVPGPSAWAFVRRGAGAAGPPLPPLLRAALLSGVGERAVGRGLPPPSGGRERGRGRAPRCPRAAGFVTKSARRQLRGLGGAMLLGRGRRRGTWRRLRAGADCSLLGPEPRVGSGGPGSRFPSPRRGPFPSGRPSGAGGPGPFPSAWAAGLGGPGLAVGGGGRHAVAGL